eukprot:scaffold1519_cov250-Pinguiococcus_pyrenoidosus.AAC.2
MSWDAYVTTQLLETGAVSRANGQKQRDTAFERTPQPLRHSKHAVGPNAALLPLLARRLPKAPSSERTARSGQPQRAIPASSGLDVATPYTVNVTQVRGGQGDGPGAAKPGGKVELTPPRPQEDGSEQPTEVLECSLIADYARSGERPAAGLRIGKSKYLAGRAATDQDTGEAASASKRPGDLRFSLTPRDWGQPWRRRRQGRCDHLQDRDGRHHRRLAGSRGTPEVAVGRAADITAKADAAGAGTKPGGLWSHRVQAGRLPGGERHVDLVPVDAGHAETWSTAWTVAGGEIHVWSGRSRAGASPTSRVDVQLQQRRARQS